MNVLLLTITIEVALFFATFSATTFVLVYLRVPWRTSTVGRATMYMWIDIAAILWLAATARLFNMPPDIRIYLAAAIYVGLAVSLGRMTLVLIRIVRDPDEMRRRDEKLQARAQHRAEAKQRKTSEFARARKGNS